MRWYGYVLIALVVIGAGFVAVLFLPSVLEGDYSDVDIGDVHPAYDNLTPDQQISYRKMYLAVSEYWDYCSFWKLSPDEAEGVIYAFISDNPQFFWFPDTYSYGSYGLSFLGTFITALNPIDKAKIQSESSEIDDVVSDLTITGNDYDRVMQIHDYLATTIWYEFGDDDQTLYGALVDRRCVCAGYATAFNYLCKINGIEAIYQSGTVDGYDDSHAWNVVLVDGSWYYVDVTWDDRDCPGVCCYMYFLIGSETEVSDKVFSEVRHPKYTFGVTTSADAYPGYQDLPRTNQPCVMLSSDQFEGYTHNSKYIVVGDITVTFDPASFRALGKVLKDAEADYLSITYKVLGELNVLGLTAVRYDIGFFMDDKPLDPESLKISGITLEKGDITVQYDAEGHILGMGPVTYTGPGEYIMS